MGLGKKKGHVHGSNVSGGHSTLIDGADDVIKRLGNMPWFISVRPAVISVARGGTSSVTIRRHPDTTHRNTLKLIFRKPGTAQDVYIHANDLDANLSTIVADISRVVAERLRGAEVYNRTTERMREEVRQQIGQTTQGARLLEKWKRRR